MIYLDPSSGVPLYQQLYQSIRAEIASGLLSHGQKLPSIASMARDLAVSHNTVEHAYALLTDEGYLQSLKGSGFRVQYASHALHTTHSKERSISMSQPQRPLYDFYYGNLSAESFPVALWRRLTNQALSFDTASLSLYPDKQGEPELRQQIASYLNRFRGMSCPPERVFVSGGVHYLLDTVAKLPPAGRRVLAIEEPGYDRARDVFRNNGYEIIPVPVRNDGVDIDALANVRADILFTTPSCQMPTGAVMPLDNRHRLLEWASATGALIIEDDYEHEYRHGSPPLPSLQSIDTYGCVVYTGTFSKVFSPALRMGYFVLPDRLLARYDEVFGGYYCPIPWLQQRILTLYMQQGYWERRINKMSAQNTRKREIFLAAVNKYFGGRVQVRSGGAGTFAILEFGQDLPDTELIAQAALQNIKVYSAAPFWHRSGDRPHNELLLGFSALSGAQIRDGISMLSEIWFG